MPPRAALPLPLGEVAPPLGGDGEGFTAVCKTLSVTSVRTGDSSPKGGAKGGFAAYYSVISTMGRHTTSQRLMGVPRL